MIRHVRPKLTCTHCKCTVQAWPPSRPIQRGVAGPGLLAHVLVAKYADHLPLYRQSEAACWADVRRKFYDLQQAHASPVAREALERITALYAIEKEIRGRPSEERQQVRSARAKPLLKSLRQWFEATLTKLSRKSARRSFLGSDEHTVAFKLPEAPDSASAPDWRRCCEGEDPPHLEDSTMSNLPQQRDRLHPTEALCNPFPPPLTDGTANVLRGASINRAPAWPPQILRHARCDL